MLGFETVAPVPFGHIGHSVLLLVVCMSVRAGRGQLGCAAGMREHGYAWTGDGGVAMTMTIFGLSGA